MIVPTCSIYRTNPMTNPIAITVLTLRATRYYTKWHINEVSCLISRYECQDTKKKGIIRKYQCTALLMAARVEEKAQLQALSAFFFQVRPFFIRLRLHGQAQPF